MSYEQIPTYMYKSQITFNLKGPNVIEIKVTDRLRLKYVS
jgi:hypothetical protein